MATPGADGASSGAAGPLVRSRADVVAVLGRLLAGATAIDDRAAARVLHEAIGALLELPSDDREPGAVIELLLGSSTR